LIVAARGGFGGRAGILACGLAGHGKRDSQAGE